MTPHHRSGKPAVSIIVLGYNGRKFVDPCLDSLLDQDFDRPYEVLYVDNGSSDGSADAASQFEGVIVHRLDRNYGYCVGNNKGFALAEGDLVAFVNQDIVAHRSWLREMVAAIESSHDIQAGHACLINPWNPEFAAQVREGPVGAAYAAELSRLGYIEYRTIDPQSPVVDTLFLSGSCTLVKRDVIERIGGYVFDPDMFLYGEDMDLALRIRSAGFRTVAAPRAVVYHFHTLRQDMSLKTFLRIVRIIRNRLLSVWKATDWPEFAVLGTVTMLGAPFNSTQFGLPLGKKVAYFLLLIPPSLIAGVSALLAMPAYAERRRSILQGRRTRRWWLTRALLFDRARSLVPPRFP